MQTVNTPLTSLVHEWTKGRFSMRTARYVGHGPNTGDLNLPILDMIHKGLSREVGGEAAANFVRFVNSLTDLSPEIFIMGFKEFWDSECRITSFRECGIMSYHPLTPSSQATSDHIREAFVREHILDDRRGLRGKGRVQY